MTRRTFPDPLVVEFVDPKPSRLFGESVQFRLVGEFRFGDIVVPEGFVTDGASIPRSLWWLYNPFGPWFKAAVVHDFLYRTDTKHSRAESDAIFLEGMRVVGVPRHRRMIMYLVLRVAGWAAWSENARADGREDIDD